MPTLLKGDCQSDLHAWLGLGAIPAITGHSSTKLIGCQNCVLVRDR